MKPLREFVYHWKLITNTDSILECADALKSLQKLTGGKIAVVGAKQKIVICEGLFGKKKKAGFTG